MLPSCVLFSLTTLAPTSAQSSAAWASVRGDGLEVGINLAAFNQIKADVAAGVYDRPCTEAEHDPTKWHTLVNVEAKCHYDHQHGDDPNYVDDIFGEPGAWFGNPGQSISYPWQTFSIPDGMSRYSTAEEAGAIGHLENDAKHEGYYWVVRRDQPCNSDSGEFCVKDFRVQFHGMMVGAGAATRYHSMSAEVRVCRDVNDLSTCGIIRTGGWMDHGRLYVYDVAADPGHAANCAFAAGDNLIHIPLPVDTQYWPLQTVSNPLDEERCHPQLTPEMIAAGPSLTDPGSGPKAEWWAHGASDFRFQLQVNNPLGNVYETSPGSGQLQNQLFCSVEDPQCDWNQSIISMRLQYIVPVNDAFVNDVSTDTLTNLPLGVRYINRFGSINSTCTAAGLDCIPIEYSHIVRSIPVGGLAAFLHTPCKSCERVDYDISPPNEQWITWFYKKFAGYVAPDPDTVPDDPTPEGPAMYFEVDHSSDTTANVNLQLIDVSDVYGVQIECAVDPSILQGGTLIPGEFNDEQQLHR